MTTASSAASIIARVRASLSRTASCESVALTDMPTVPTISPASDRSGWTYPCRSCPPKTFSLLAVSPATARMCASIAEFDMRSEPRNSGSFRPTTSSAAIPRAARSEPKIAVQRRSASVVQTTPGNASRSVRNDSSAEEDSGPFGSGDAIGGVSTPLRRAEGQASLTKARGRRPIDIGPDIPWARGGAAKGAEMTESVGRSAWHGIEVRHLAALQALAEEASFHGAARRLGYSQPAVSQQLAALERIVD